MGEESFSELEVQEPKAVEEDIGQRKRVYRGRSWIVPLLLGTGLGIAIALGGMRVLSNRSVGQPSVATNKLAQKAAPTMTVTIALAETTRVARILNTTGTIAARDLIPVLPQTNGVQIKKIPEFVKEGAFVKAGQVLAVLDDSILLEQIRQAQADVESRLADVASKQAEIASKQADVVSSQAGVASNQAIVQQRQADLAQARARLVDIQRTFQRNQQLAAQGAISTQQLDTAATNLATATEAVRLAEANITSAQADVNSARANIGSTQANVNSAEANVNSAQSAVKSAQARVAQLKTQLGQTLVRAPVSGVVAEKLARVGDVTGVPSQNNLVPNVVNGSQKLFSIIQDGLLELQAQVPENQLPGVKLGAPVQITLDDDNRVRLPGEVREIEPVVNQQRREATVKINLPPTKLLKPGMFARADITTATATGVAVPQKAVLPQPDGNAIVFILLGEDTVRAQKVEVGEILIGGRVEIKSGLQRGVRVVVDGAGYIKDGDRVRVVNRQSSIVNSQ